MRGYLDLRLVSGVLVIGVLAALPAFAQRGGDECPEIVLHNGKISTLDPRDTVASSIVIRDGRFAAVGTGRGIPKHGGCALVIDLRGRRVVPGLVDNHSHIVSLGLRPGYDTRLETAFNIAEVQQAIRNRARTVPAGGFITAIGGWHTNQIAEKRLPTGAELDAADSTHPVLVALAFAGPASVNGLGRAWLQGKGVTVGADGAIAANAPTLAAFNALRAVQTLEDQKRTTLDSLNYAASLGLTTHQDKGGGWPAKVEGAEGLAQLGNGGSNELDPFTGYDALLALYREGKLKMGRMRIFFSSRDQTADLVFLRQRVNNQFRDFGDDWMKVSGIGEWGTAWSFNTPPPPANYEAAMRLVAEKGWAFTQHTGGIEDLEAIVPIWERVNQRTPLAPLRWNLEHVPGITKELLERLKAIGVGTGVGGNRYLSGAPGTKGAPFKMIVDSGIHTGYGDDGANISPLNPWLHFHYLVTGKNSGGQVIEPNQQLTRIEALRLWGSQNAWFTKEEDKMGSIEIGKFADLAVLSADVLDASQVSDEAIKRITSVLTLVDGKVVHDSGVLTGSGSRRSVAQSSSSPGPAAAPQRE
jgi:predicted amidohydrolase YtcJ